MIGNLSMRLIHYFLCALRGCIDSTKPRLQRVVETIERTAVRISRGSDKCCAPGERNKSSGHYRVLWVHWSSGYVRNRTFVMTVVYPEFGPSLECVSDSGRSAIQCSVRQDSELDGGQGDPREGDVPPAGGRIQVYSDRDEVPYRGSRCNSARIHKGADQQLPGRGRYCTV